MTPYELNQYRVLLDLSVPQMTSRLGVHERTWYRWTSGQRPIPLPIENLVKLMAQYTKRREKAHG